MAGQAEAQTVCLTETILTHLDHFHRGKRLPVLLTTMVWQISSANESPRSVFESMAVSRGLSIRSERPHAYGHGGRGGVHLRPDGTTVR
jgi:hypothetical protein